MKATFAANLTKLRNAASMTQLELAERLNFSDKAVSKWERAESMPDVYTVKQLADLFQVSVDDLLTPSEEWKKPVIKGVLDKKHRITGGLITLVVLVSIVAIALLVFVILWLAGLPEPRVFVYMLPAVFITWLVLNSTLLDGKHNRYITMGLVFSVVAVVYAALISLNPWQLFLFAIPAEAVTWLSFYINRQRKK